jgi:hypothetical protein
MWPAPLLAAQPDALAQGPDPRIVDGAFIEGSRVLRIAEEGERDWKRHAVLGDHRILGFRDVVPVEHLMMAFDVDRVDIVCGKDVLGLQVL